MSEDKLVESKPEEEVMDKKELPSIARCEETIKRDAMHILIAQKCGGGHSKDFGEVIFGQLAKHCGGERDILGILDIIEGVKPKDHVEGMLATQMIVIHNNVMKCFERASSYLKSSQIPTLEMGNAMLNSAIKLTRTFTMQMEALNRYRSRGQQKMTVEHVHINAGGQAIIGNVTKNTPQAEGEGEGKK